MPKKTYCIYKVGDEISVYLNEFPNFTMRYIVIHKGIRNDSRGTIKLSRKNNNKTIIVEDQWFNSELTWREHKLIERG